MIKHRKAQLTASEVTAKLQALALIPVETLHRLTVRELHENLRYLADKVSSLKKQDAIDKILELTKELRERKQKEIENTVLTDESVSDCINENKLKSYYDKGLNGEDVGNILFKNALSLGYSNTTIAKTWSKKIRVNLEFLYNEQLISLEWKESVYKAYRTNAGKLDHEYNQKYQASKEMRLDVSEKVTLDGVTILNWATDILYNPNPKKYGMISLALAISSGRRMDELHGTCEFFLVDSTHIKAVGLSKKSDENNEFIFQTLIDSKVWLDGYNLIPSDKKGHNQATVNLTIRKTIENHTKSYLDLLGFKSYKDSRDFYALYMLNNFFDGGLEDTIKYVRDILGHESTKQSLSYTKFTLKKQS